MNKVQLTSLRDIPPNTARAIGSLSNSVVGLMPDQVKMYYSRGIVDRMLIAILALDLFETINE